MTTRTKTKLIHEGSFAAEVDIDVIDDDGGWAPYLSVDDAKKLDAVREALRAGNFDAASRLGRVYELRPMAQSK